MKQDALDFLESHKKREYTHTKHSIDCECIVYVPLHIAKMALDMMSENKEVIAEKYATVKKDVIGRHWAEADEKDAFVGCIQELEPGTRIKVVVIKQD
jgi:hypothetical protein